MRCSAKFCRWNPFNRNLRIGNFTRVLLNQWTFSEISLMWRHLAKKQTKKKKEGNWESTQHFLNMYPVWPVWVIQNVMLQALWRSCTATDRMIIYTNARTPNNTDSFEKRLVQICFGLAEAEQTAAANIRRINCERFRLLWAAFPSSWPDSSRHNCLIKDISVMETYISLH